MGRRKSKGVVQSLRGRKEQKQGVVNAECTAGTECARSRGREPASRVPWPQKSQCVGLSHPRSGVRSPWTPSSAPTFWASGHEMLMGPSPAVPMTRPPRSAGHSELAIKCCGLATPGTGPGAGTGDGSTCWWLQLPPPFLLGVFSHSSGGRKWSHHSWNDCWSQVPPLVFSSWRQMGPWVPALPGPPFCSSPAPFPLQAPGETPLSWQELEGERASSCTHKRSASWGSTDHRKEITKLKQQLQRTKLSRSGKEKERGSPLQGDHAVRGALRASPPSFPSGSAVLRLSPCLHRSLEGLNQELEEVFVKEQGEEELLRILEIPDGHRAPAPPQSGSCDHPLLLLEPGNLASSPSTPLASPQPSGQTSREEHQGAAEELTSIPSDKASPPGHPAFLEEGSPSPVLAFASSPRPNHSYVFKREPPEGCERVRVFEEATSPGPDLAFLTSCPDKNKVHFNPTGSAFCPVSLMKPLFPSMGFIFRNCPSSPGSPLPPASPRPPPRKDPEAPKASSLPFEPWQRPPPSEEPVLFQSSLVV
ncbi:protein FAM117A isoform X2 [Globicephala melas]|uniref:protein FAM117A isoform X2 n=1 Tax=Globicephala melas TaxID=9731 RepID=UPI00293D6840|nr:protein FAM117A isoform X2 [Globicephala melas]